MRIRSISLVLALGWIAAATLPAQSTWLHDDDVNGFSIRLPRFLKAQPREPHEEQILAKFAGKFESPDRFLKGEQELTLLVVRIRKSQGPTTGSKEEQEKEEERGKSFGEQSKEHLNAGTTLSEFLKHRSWKHDLGKSTLKRAPKCRIGAKYDIAEIRGTAFNEARWEDRDYPIIRTFSVEDEQEIFGVVVLGPGVGPFEDLISKCVQTLERFAPGTTARTGPDPYEGSALRDLDRRRRVRSRLVKGWTAHDTENFILITNSTNKKLIQDVLIDLEVMRKEYEKHLPPLEPVTTVSAVRICASYDDYLDYGAPDGTGGYWSPLDEELVLFEPGRAIPKVRPWLKEVDPVAVMYHEAMHQYLHYSNGMVPPTSWFNEGYGEVFGGAEVDRRKQEIQRIDKNKFRMKWIKLMQKQKAWPDLRSVVKMSQGEFYGMSALQNYAIGWAFCYFLEQERKKEKGRNEAWAAIPTNYINALRAATKKRMEKMPDDAPKDWIMAYTDEIQEEAFEAAFANIDFDALEQAWIEAMKKY